LAIAGHPGRLPLLHIESVPYVLPPIPRRNRRMRFSSLILRRRPCPLLRRVGFRGDGFGACSVFTACCSPHGLLTPLRSLVLECFSPFVTSWSAPSASGWDEHRRPGFPPEDSTCLFKAHPTSPIPPGQMHDGWASGQCPVQQADLGQLDAASTIDLRSSHACDVSASLVPPVPSPNPALESVLSYY